MPQQATWELEATYWQQGITLLAGVDEVGMGALAGPVVAAAVIFDGRRQAKSAKRKAPNTGVPPKRDDIQIRDSKTLSLKQRQRAAEWIREHAVAYATGEASVAEINELNIRVASHLAMRRAIDALATIPELLLIDGRPAQPHNTIPATNIIDGDALVFSIAAASILAKVHRDMLMVALAEQHPGYALESNKGYGSASHLAALGSLGATEHHRAAYAPVARVLD